MLKKIITFFLLLFQIQVIFSINYYVDINHPNSNDSNDCLSIENPCYTIGGAMNYMINNLGSTIYIREGIYRMLNQFLISLKKKTNSTHFFTIQNYPGERVQLFGSLSTEGKTWKLYNSSRNVWRLNASFLSKDPNGMFFGNKRVEHQTYLAEGRRYHDHAYNLVDENYWTRAFENGSQCFSKSVGCYIYLIPENGVNPNNNIYELSQREFGRITSDYTVIKGLEFYYTQPTPIIFEGSDYLLIENNVFGHISNGEGNSYGLMIWNSGGSIVRNNTVYDSKYWGGISNSKGITFMVSDIGNPNIVEYNHIYDIPGKAAVGTKAGVSGLIVRYNYIHDVFEAFNPPGYRCVWSNTNTDGCQEMDIEFRPGGDWEIYGNIVLDSTIGLNFGTNVGTQYNTNDNNKVFKNLFYNVEKGIFVFWNNSFNNSFHDNLFINNTFAIYMGGSGGKTTIVEDYLNQYDSNYNVFFNSNYSDILLKPNWRGDDYKNNEIYNLNEFQNQFNRELNSTILDPLLDINYIPAINSPICGNGLNGSDIGPINCDGSNKFNFDLDSPTKVQNLNYINLTDLTIKLNWDMAIDNKKVKGYEIYRNNIKIGDMKFNFFIDGQFESNSSYEYKIRAYDFYHNYGSFSDSLIFTFPKIPILCQENWNYSYWSLCLNETQNRTAIDLNSCGTEINKSIIFQSCVIISDSCGNNTIETGEVCDGFSLNGETCKSKGYDKGTLSCKIDCSGYDISSCSNDNDDSRGSSGGGSSGGITPSPFSLDLIDNINLTTICIPSYKYSEWSVCEDGIQTQFIEEFNDCSGDILEERICNVDLSEEENLLLNAKNITLEKIDSKKYKASLDSGYNEIFYINDKLEDEIFLFQDETSGEEYYGQYYDEVDDKYYYTLKRVDEGVVIILQDEGILSNLSQDVTDLKEDELFFKLLIGFVIILFFGSIIFAVYYVKKIKGNERDFF